MAILMDKAVFLRMPKTGSQWAEQAIRNAGLVRKHVGKNHSRLNTVTSFLHQENLDHKTIVMVRNPVTWYISRWSSKIHRRRLQEGKGWKVDAVRPGEKEGFNLWMNRIMDEYPGYLCRFYRKFTGPDFNTANFIGRQENLTNDLIRILKEAGEDFSAKDIRNTPVINEASERLKAKALYHPKTLNRLFDLESDSFKAFDYSIDSDDYEKYFK